MKPVYLPIKTVRVNPLEYCKRQGWTDPQKVNDNIYAFPPGAVMPVLVPETQRTEMVWECHPKFIPFYMADFLEYGFKVNGWEPDFPYREVWRSREDKVMKRYVAVRTDTLLPWWHFWWVYYRLQESFKLTTWLLIHIAEIWNLAVIYPGEIPHWGCLGRRKESCQQVNRRDRQSRRKPKTGRLSTY